MYTVKLYTYSGESNPNWKEAVSNLRRFLEEEFGNQYSLEIINLSDKPELADRDNIFATPTVIKTSPLPTRRILGDLTSKEKVFTGLGLAELRRRPTA